MLQMSPNMFSHVFLTSRPVRFIPITIPPSSSPWHLEVSRITTVQASRSPSRSVCSDPALLKVLLTAMSSGQLRPDMRWPTWELLRPKKIICHIYICIYTYLLDIIDVCIYIYWWCNVYVYIYNVLTIYHISLSICFIICLGLYNIIII